MSVGSSVAIHPFAEPDPAWTTEIAATAAPLAPDLAQAAGDRVAAAIRSRVVAPEGVVGDQVSALLGAATAHAARAGITLADLPAVLDLASSLLPITTTVDLDAMAPVLADHCATAGALAVHLFHAGVTPLAGGLLHVLSVHDFGVDGPAPIRSVQAAKPGAEDAFAALARFASGVTGIPSETARAGRLLLLDGLGALTGALHYPVPRRLTSNEDVDSVIAIGSLATWLDAESGGSFHPDGGRLPPVPTAHAGAHAAPLLLVALDAAAADGNPIEDSRAILAYLVSVEIGLRLSIACSLRPGLHPHGIHGPVAAGLLRGLLSGGVDLHQVLLWSAAVPVATALRVPIDGGTVRNLWTGLGAWHGLRAVDLARAGNRLDPAAVVDLFDKQAATGLDPVRLSGGLGERWELDNSYLKLYACARWIHPALDALALALAQLDASADDIAAISVTTYEFAASLSDPAPHTDMHARFSLPYSVAAYSYNRRLDARSFSEIGMARDAVADLARRVAVTADPAFTAALPERRPARVTITTFDGRSAVGEVANARGNPDDPLSNAEVIAKFRGNVEGIVEKRVANAMVRALVSEPEPLASYVLTEFARNVMAVARGAGGR